MPTSKFPRLHLGAAAVLLATAFNHFADRILGVQIEAFSGGVSYFSFSWALDLFLVPFIAGAMIAVMYGRGGKWLSVIPPIVVRTISYYGIAGGLIRIPMGATLMPRGWWGFYLILAIEAAMVGGVIGEVVIKRTYGRSPPQSPAESTRPAGR